MGGQTALNCALDLARHGVLEKYGVEMIGASREAIDKAEDREKFKQAMTRIGLDFGARGIAHSMEEALQVQAMMGYPTMIRPSFTMGGIGRRHRLQPRKSSSRSASAAWTPRRPRRIADRGIADRLERIRDGGGARQADNCIIICSIENLDPMGVHTGDSITVAPAQTLTDKEYQIMRNASHRGAARDRRGDRRLQRAVRHQSRRRAHGGDRDEPARVAFLGAGLQGDRFPDRQGGRQAGGGLHARTN